MLRDGGEVLGLRGCAARTASRSWGETSRPEAMAWFAARGKVMLVPVCQRHEAGGILGAHESNVFERLQASMRVGSDLLDDAPSAIVELMHKAL